MLYLTGIHALHVPCSLDTNGVPKIPEVDWKTVNFVESSEMFFGDYGIEYNVHIPEHKDKVCVANHIRASLDLLAMGKLDEAEGMSQFIGNAEYNAEIFEKVYSMKSLPHWKEIERFMEAEYRINWIHFIDRMRQKEMAEWKRERVKTLLKSL